MNSPQTDVLCQAFVDKCLKRMPSLLVGDIDWKRQMVSWPRYGHDAGPTRVNLAVESPPLLRELNLRVNVLE